MSDSDSPAVETPLPTISIDYSERVNFAFQQNAIPVLRRLEIHNNTENDWHNVSCRLNTQPEWAEPHSQDILRTEMGSCRNCYYN